MGGNIVNVSTARRARLLSMSGKDELALVYALQLGGSDDDRFAVETVDSVDPRYPRREKTVIILSTQFGCPVGCPMCDAGGSYAGNLTAEQMLEQVRFVVSRRPEILESRKLKVHFARMGEPALNGRAVLRALERLQGALPAPGLMPCVATVAPASAAVSFIEELTWLKRRLYRGGRFQLQLSVNSTDPDVRERLIPIPHLDLDQLARLGRRFFEPGDRKIALNFALARGVPLDADALERHFDPACFMVKLTPVNPTARSRSSGLDTVLSAEEPEAAEKLVARLTAVGFDVVVSIGEAEEIAIGSNCGQLVRARPWRQAETAA
jgi:23S rRNA (adenine2503-C2)-methyltransferase